MLSLCLTNYNRYEMLIESFEHVLHDDRISEVIISDDHSDLTIYNKLLDRFKNEPKVKISRNPFNLGMSRNKKRAIELASNEWCILFDSDNVIKPDYLDAILIMVLFDHAIYCPEAALPEFDYRFFAGQTINRKNIHSYLQRPMFDCLLNTCNYVVNREKYLEVYQHDPKIKASDTIHFNYLWLKSGGSFYVVPEMKYFHRVHKGSGFLADTQYNLRQAEQTKNLIMQL
jgi:glycosyltransferase involved in cell wall biosynthesis